MNRWNANERLGFGTTMVDWERRVDFVKLRAERLERAQNAMRAANVDFLVLSRLENARYTTGIKRLYWPTIRLGAGPIVALPQQGEPAIWITDPSYAAQTLEWVAADRFRDGPEMELEPDVRQFVDELLEFFPGAASARIGVDVWSPVMHELMPQLLSKAELVDGQAIMLDARKNKTFEEIQLLKMGYVISEAGMQAAYEALRPGVRESELVGVALKRFWDFASETVQCSENVNSGPGTFPYRRFHTDRIVQWGDVVNMDFGACFNGYFGDFCRGFVCGDKPNPKQQEMIKRAYDAQMSIVDAMRPGIRPADIAEKVGFKHLGHGFGISAFEPPHLRVPMDDFVIEPGMTFAIGSPTSIGSPELGCIHYEDQLYVTEDGCVQYSTYPYFGIDQ
jgi:Xaa-Pro aminopeptidase